MRKRASCAGLQTLLSIKSHRSWRTATTGSASPSKGKDYAISPVKPYAKDEPINTNNPPANFQPPPAANDGSTDAFNSFLGQVGWLLSGGVAGGNKYESDGTYIGPAPYTGTPDLVGGPVKGVITLSRSKDVLGHVFRNAAGHVNPTTIASQNRYVQLFENVANDAANVNRNVLTNFQKTSGGFQGYAKTYSKGQQVWVQTYNGTIINAGINAIPK